MEELSLTMLKWGAASAPLPDEEVSGDRYLVKPFPDGVLLAVVDALGHGGRAAQVAARAVETLECHADESVSALVSRCHRALVCECGATMSLASFDWRSRRVTWLGVGNVSGVLMPQSASGDTRVRHLLVRGGVVGGDLPSLEPTTIALTPGDVLIMATDGIRENFADALPQNLAPQPLAEYVFHRYAKSTDDALVLVTRYAVKDHEHPR